MTKFCHCVSLLVSGTAEPGCVSTVIIEERGAVSQTRRESLVALEWRSNSNSVVRYLGLTIKWLVSKKTDRGGKRLTGWKDGGIGGLNMDSSSTIKMMSIIV